MILLTFIKVIVVIACSLLILPVTYNAISRVPGICSYNWIRIGFGESDSGGYDNNWKTILQILSEWTLCEKYSGGLFAQQNSRGTNIITNEDLVNKFYVNLNKYTNTITAAVALYQPRFNNIHLEFISCIIISFPLIIATVKIYLVIFARRKTLVLKNKRHVKTVASGEVFSMEEINNGDETKEPSRKYTVKVLRKNDLVRGSRQVIDPKRNANYQRAYAAVKELNIMKKLRKAPFTEHIIAAFQNASQLYSIYERSSGRPLSALIRMFNVLPEKVVKFFTCEVICALQYMHARGIVLKALCLDSILITDDNHVAIIYFDQTDYDGTPLHELTYGVFIKFYTGPEIRKRMMVSISTDWWALGMCMYAMLHGRLPIDSDNEDVNEVESFSEVLTSPIDEIDENNEGCVEFIEGLLDPNPDSRLGPAKSNRGPIQKHPYLSDVDWSAVRNKTVPAPNLYSAGCSVHKPRSLPKFIPFQPNMIQPKVKEFMGVTLPAEIQKMRPPLLFPYMTIPANEFQHSEDKLDAGVQERLDKILKGYRFGPAIDIVNEDEHV